MLDRPFPLYLAEPLTETAKIGNYDPVSQVVVGSPRNDWTTSTERTETGGTNDYDQDTDYDE